MRKLLLILTLALSAAPATGQAGGLDRHPRGQSLPPETAYRDPRPRFRVRPPVEAYAVRAYVPRPTYQPLFNEPPKPLQ